MRFKINFKVHLSLIVTFIVFFVIFQYFKFLIHQQQTHETIKNIEKLFFVLQIEYKNTPQSELEELERKHTYLSALMNSLSARTKLYIVAPKIDRSSYVFSGLTLPAQHMNSYLMNYFDFFYLEKEGYRLVAQKMANSMGKYIIFLEPIDTLKERYFFDTYEDLSFVEYVWWHQERNIVFYYFLFFYVLVFLSILATKKYMVKVENEKNLQISKKISQLDNDARMYAEKYYTVERQYTILERPCCITSP